MVFAWLDHARLGLAQPAPVARHLLIALGLTTAFALLGWLASGVDASGGLAGFAVALVFAARDLAMFWVLLVVFAVTLLATRSGADRKRQLRGGEYPNGDEVQLNEVQKRDDRRGRSASQVMANLGVAGLIVAVAPLVSPAVWPVLALAALAEAAADTCSSEIGMAFPGKTVLITTWKSVPPGMDGGVSLYGTAAALLAAGVVAGTGRLLGLVPTHLLVAIVLAGFLGIAGG